MEFRILGPLEALEDGRGLDLGAQKHRALLAVLLLDANRVVSTDRLLDALWEDAPPETARKALQVYVSQLRKIVGRERLERRAPGYVLHVGPDELDLERFARLRADGRLRDALALWRGPPLAELAPLPFAENEGARLEELRLACLEERIEQDVRSRCTPELVAELEALVCEHPLREPLRSQLMLALYRSGRQAEALEVYQDARRTLVDELGIEPGHSLRELQQAILNQDAALDLAADDVPAASTRGVFVGRERELDELVEGLDQAFRGRGRLFLLVGEPGIGKSRLAEELSTRARARGARVLVGRCWEAGGAPAYWPWLQSLRAYVRESDPETLRQQLGPGAADLAQLLPELRELLLDLPDPPVLESESARFRLFEAVSSFVRSAAKTRPLVLVFDDLHAADQPSLLLLQFLARELGESRLLVVGSYRNVDPTPAEPLTEALGELVREPVTRTLELAGLPERDVARFIELTCGEAPSETLVLTICEDTEGNPFFVGEIVRLLEAEGRLGDADLSRPTIPQSVRDVIARRLRHLSKECNRVLVLASVLGREFSLEALAHLAGASEDDLLDTLDQAMAAGVISDVPGSPSRLRFAHVLIRDTLYEGLTTVRRVRLHRLAVEALELLYGEEPGPHLAELAHHSVAGSEFENGVRYGSRAGARALALLAYEEAARLYSMALDALELSAPDDETSRCELLLSLGEAQIRAGDNAAAKEAFLEAAAMARRLNLPHEVARAAVGYGGRIMFERAGGDERLVPLLEEGLAAVGREDVELRVRLLARLAGALRDEPSRDRRDDLSREAVEIARDAGSPAALAYALDGRLAAIVAPDTIAERLELATELHEAAKRSGERERDVAAHFHRFIALLEIGDAPTAQLDLTTAIEIAEQLRQPAQLWQVTGARAMFALAQGRFDEAEKLAHQALALGERSIAVFALPAFRMHMYALRMARGNIDDLESMLLQTVAEYPARPFIRCALAHFYAVLGRTEEAQHEFNRLTADGFVAIPFDIEWLYGMSLLADTCALLTDRRAAAELYEKLLPYSGFIAVDVPEGSRGAVSRYLGLLAALLRRWDDAGRHLEQALEMNERLGLRPWLAHTQHDYARILLERDAPRERERALELVQQALATYRELGMGSHAARASQLAASYATHTTRPPRA
jgi:DNA-binding SARP family transcriptional activator/tetratricopeptide (TPR) repeat protein